MHRLIIIFILLLIIIRVPALFHPLLGNFSTKQTIYAMIAKNFSEDGQILYPKINHLINGKKSLHLLELPYPAYFAGIIWKTFGGNLDFWGRFINFLFFLFSLVFLYFLSFLISGNKYLSLILCNIFLLLPITTIFSTCFQMEGAMLFFLFGGIYFFFKWFDTKKFYFSFVWSIFSIFLLLVKPQALIYYILPLCIFLLEKEKLNIFRKLYPYLFVLITTPILLWFLHIKKLVTLNDNIFYSLVDSIGVRIFPSPILFQINFYKDLFDKFSGVLFTPLGFTLLLFGVFTKINIKHRGFLYIWGFCTLLYILILPRKMVELTYYLLPVACVGVFFIAFAIKTIMIDIQFPKHTFIKSKMNKFLFIVLILIISLRYSYAPMFKFSQYDKYVINAGEFVDNNLPKDSLIIAAHGSSCDLLYYCKRNGWTFWINRSEFRKVYTEKEKEYFAKTKKRIFINPIQELNYLINNNARYLIVTPKEDLFRNKPFYDYISKKFLLIKETEGYIVYSLQKLIDG